MSIHFFPVRNPDSPTQFPSIIHEPFFPYPAVDQFVVPCSNGKEWMVKPRMGNSSSSGSNRMKPYITRMEMWKEIFVTKNFWTKRCPVDEDTSIYCFILIPHRNFSKSNREGHGNNIKV